MDEKAIGIMTPLIQLGFAGLCIILLGILVWVIRELIKVLKETNAVIAGNTQAIQSVDKNAKDALDVSIELKNDLLQRPCIAKFKQG
ncbi:MAG TPA: hypothetical protein DDW84_01375 [Phycisphaerales bacterium]|nr:MAG: hypothetical protein A2Y13_01170 [Planctomycetes bacterium GWC2_45_44]HBG77487.1 hypothetical protein [Phycisphaerales bacterium]HBR19095.1 hypothetical protein [Phycisphaerales bacterium]